MFFPASQITGCNTPADTTSFNGGTLVVSKNKNLLLLFSAGSPGGNLSVIESNDMGGTWSLARPVADAHGKRILSSGMVNNGIQLKHGVLAGRLVVPREVFYGAKSPSDPSTPGGFENKVGLLFSDDDGATWSAGDFLPAPFRQEESAIAELTNGSIVITCRNGQNRSASNLCQEPEICRVFARSDDGGKSWARTWHLPVAVLPAHRCEAAMASADLNTHETGVLLFGAPMNSTTGDRTNYTIYTSLDGGDTWKWGASVYAGMSGYSSLIVLRTQQVGARAWEMDIGASFQLGHGIHSVEGGGYDMAFAKRSIVVEA